MVGQLSQVEVYDKLWTQNGFQPPFYWSVSESSSSFVVFETLIREWVIFFAPQKSNSDNHFVYTHFNFEERGRLVEKEARLFSFREYKWHFSNGRFCLENRNLGIVI